MCASISAGDSLRALYNKYRPQGFADVAGQGHVVRILQNALVHNRVSHAYLFSGERGTGKTTVGRILAKALNCQRGIQPEPCNDCEHCRSVGAEAFLDLIEIDAASHTSVNDIRDLREKVRYRPAAGRYKVYLIDEVHQLSRSAYNAFLKTLEEPPDHAVFILATTDPHRVLPTVRSRCQHLRFKRIGHAQMISQLQRIVRLEEAMADDQALALIARNAEGSLRDALGLLEQGLAYADNRLTERQMRELLGAAGYEGVSVIAAAIARGAVNDAMTALAKSVDDGADPTALHRQLVGFFRAVLMLLTSRSESVLNQYSSDELAVLREVANSFARIRQPLAVVEALTERPPLTAARPPQLDLELAVVQASLAGGADDAVRPTPVSEISVPAKSAPVAPEPAATPVTEPEQTAESRPAPDQGPLQSTADSPVGSDSLARFESVRERFIALVREWDPTAAGQFLAAPARLDGSDLILGLQQAFTLERLNSPANRSRLQQSAQTALGQSVHIRLEQVKAGATDDTYTARIAKVAGELLGAREIGET